MAFDDYYNTPISEGYENTTSPSLILVMWGQALHGISISVTAATPMEAATVVPPGPHSMASANPLPTSVDISCAAAYHVLIRFSYLQAPETGDAYSHYYWGIDDVTIYENIVSNDLSAVLLSNGDIENAFEYQSDPYGA